HGTHDLLFAVFIPNHLLASLRHDCPRHAFFVQNAGIAWAGFHVGLITADDPVSWVQHFAAILDAGVGEAFSIARHKTERTTQFKVADHAVGPDQEGVSAGRILRRGLPCNSPVFYAPQLWIAIPPTEVFPVKETLEPRFRAMYRSYQPYA